MWYDTSGFNRDCSFTAGETGGCCSLSKDESNCAADAVMHRIFAVKSTAEAVIAVNVDDFTTSAGFGDRN